MAFKYHPIEAAPRPKEGSEAAFQRARMAVAHLLTKSPHKAVSRFKTISLGAEVPKATVDAVMQNVRSGLFVQDAHEDLPARAAIWPVEEDRPDGKIPDGGNWILQKPPLATFRSADTLVQYGYFEDETASKKLHFFSPFMLPDNELPRLGRTPFVGLLGIVCFVLAIGGTQ